MSFWPYAIAVFYLSVGCGWASAALWRQREAVRREPVLAAGLFCLLVAVWPWDMFDAWDCPRRKR